ncbi:MAG: V-type ATPase subunit [Candidatus Hadarchaeales archaeon]
MIFPLIFLLLFLLFVLVYLDARRTFPYVYCNAMISAWEGRALTPSRLVELSEADPQAMLSSLSGTDFEGLPGSVLEAERVIRERAVEKYRRILEALPPRGKRFFTTVLERFEVYNLKALLVSLHTGIPPSFLPSPLTSEERLALLSRVKSMEELLKFLAGTDYGEFLSRSMEEYKRRGLAFLLHQLDRYYYTKLWLEAERQRKSIREVIGVECDLVNLKLLARLKSAGVPAVDIRPLLVPTYLIPARVLERMLEAEELSSLLQCLSETPYAEAVARASHQVQAAGSLLPLERELEAGFLRLCRWYSTSDFFSLAPAVCFFYTKEAEVRSLRALLRLRSEKVQPAKCREMLVYAV